MADGDQPLPTPAMPDQQVADASTPPKYKFSIKGLIGDEPGAVPGQTSDTPGLAQYPGIVGSTYEQQLPTEPAQQQGTQWGAHEDLFHRILDAAPWQAQSLPSNYDRGPPVKQYGGPLGIGQSMAREAEGPLGPAVLATAPGAFVGSAAGQDIARQIGFGETGQLVGSLLGGVSIGGLVDRGLAELATNINHPARIAARFARDAGMRYPTQATVADSADAAGAVFRRELATTRTPPSNPYLLGIARAPDAAQSMDAAMANPARLMQEIQRGNLPESTRQATAAYLADTVSQQPALWTGMPPPMQRFFVPMEREQASLTQQAQAAARAAAGGTPAAAAPGAPGGLSAIMNVAGTFLKNHIPGGLVEGGIGAGIGRELAPLYNLPAETGTAAGAALGFVARPLVRELGTWRGIKNLLMSTETGREEQQGSTYKEPHITATRPATVGNQLNKAPPD